MEANFQSTEPNHYWVCEWSEPNLASVRPGTITEGQLFAVVHKSSESNPATVEPDIRIMEANFQSVEPNHYWVC